MQTLSLADLKLKRSRAKIESVPRLTPEILGRIAICAVTLYAKKRSKPVSSASLETFFMEDLASAPECIRQALHLEYSVGRIFLREETEMTVGAQQRKMAGRLNPDYSELQIKLHPMEAMTLLDQLEAEFPEAVSWVVKKARQIEMEMPLAQAQFI